VCECVRECSRAFVRACVYMCACLRSCAHVRPCMRSRERIRVSSIPFKVHIKLSQTWKQKQIIPARVLCR
jgi:hypothetical protein